MRFLSGNIFVGKKLLEKILEVLPELAVVPCKYTGQYGAWGCEQRAVLVGQQGKGTC